MINISFLRSVLLKGSTISLLKPLKWSMPFGACVKAFLMLCDLTNAFDVFSHYLIKKLYSCCVSLQALWLFQDYLFKQVQAVCIVNSVFGMREVYPRDLLYWVLFFLAVYDVLLILSPPPMLNADDNLNSRLLLLITSINLRRRCLTTYLLQGKIFS